MKNLIKILRYDLTVSQILLQIVVNGILTVLLYYLIFLGYETDFINYQRLGGNIFIFPNIITFIMILHTILFSFYFLNRLFEDSAYTMNFTTIGISQFALFWGNISLCLIYEILTVLVTAFILFIISGITFPVLSVLGFFGYLLISALMITLLISLINHMIKNNKFIQTTLIYFLIILSLMSYFLFPAGVFSYPIYTLFKYLPFSIIFETGADLLLNNQISLVGILYVSVFTITLILINQIFYKKELSK